MDRKLIFREIKIENDEMLKIFNYYKNQNSKTFSDFKEFCLYEYKYFCEDLEKKLQSNNRTYDNKRKKHKTSSEIRDYETEKIFREEIKFEEKTQSMRGFGSNSQISIENSMKVYWKAAKKKKKH